MSNGPQCHATGDKLDGVEAVTWGARPSSTKLGGKYNVNRYGTSTC